MLMLQEYKYLSRKRLAHITGSTPNPGHFAVLVRSIPKSGNELLDDTIRNFFVNYHGASYLSHQMIYRKGKLQHFVVRVQSNNDRYAFYILLELKLCTCFLVCTTSVHVYQIQIDIK
jgi:hypothetical protein